MRVKNDKDQKEFLTTMLSFNKTFLYATYFEWDKIRPKTLEYDY